MGLQSLIGSQEVFPVFAHCGSVFPESSATYSPNLIPEEKEICGCLIGGLAQWIHGLCRIPLHNGSGMLPPHREAASSTTFSNRRRKVPVWKTDRSSAVRSQRARRPRRPSRLMFLPQPGRSSYLSSKRQELLFSEKCNEGGDLHGLSMFGEPLEKGLRETHLLSWLSWLLGCDSLGKVTWSAPSKGWWELLESLASAGAVPGGTREGGTG